MPKSTPGSSGISRRRFLRDAGLATLAAQMWARPGFARVSRPPAHRQTVAVFGGGIAGLTAAHELAERGFDVTVYERRAWGGKARSTEVAGSAAGGRRNLPGEHAYRVPFGCYQNVPDTMRRIPFGANPNGVFDNLVEGPLGGFFRTKKHDIVLTFNRPSGLPPFTPQQLADLIVAVLLDMELPPAAAAYFANRMLVFFSSCDARRLGQWERQSWSDFIAADRFGDDYRKILGALPQLAQASKPKETSAKYIAWFFEVWLIYSLLGLGTNGPTLRVLNGPTNDTWIDPWLERLRQLGANLLLGHELTRLDVRDGRISAAEVRTPSGTSTVAADWYVCALPVEVAREFWTPDILDADPQLAEMNNLGTAWMNGVQFYLRERSRILPGVVACADSPWAVSFIPQAQFWPGSFASTYGDGTVHDKLSAAIADWKTPGVLFGKAAEDCTPEEVIEELWEDIKRHVNDPGRAPVLTDDMLHSWEIDPGMMLRNGHLVSGDPLVLPTAGTEQYRPDVVTGIPNLMLCGDYLNGSWEVTNMEAANFNGRRAANAILDGCGSSASKASVVGPYQPPEWKPFQRIDEALYRAGQPNPFDVDGAGVPLGTLLSRVGRL